MDTIELFLKLLSMKSITPDDGGILEFVQANLGDFEPIWVNAGGVKNLFLYKKFSEGPHLCFAGHVDVVPGGDGWQSDPFVPLIQGGFVFGRGAQDMKSGVAAMVSSLAEVKSFRGTLSLLLTSDEEGEAKYGTVVMLEHLAQLGLVPDFAIVGEPTSENLFGDTIKIGRRGSINGVIELFGRQGHAAYPEKAINPIHQIAAILPHIAGVNLDEGDEYFGPSKLVITNIHAGMGVTNVTPGSLKMMFNIRNSTKTSIEKIDRFIRSHFEGLDFTLSLTQSAKPFVTQSDTSIVKALSRSIRNVTGIVPSYSTAGGTSDARFFADYGVEVVEFGVKNDTIHASNERVGIDEVKKLKEVYDGVIGQMALL